MASIYIHIPFCKQACHYCNFHFSTALKKKSTLLTALCKELIMRRGELAHEIVTAIYLGGGTPSLLTIEEIEGLLQTVYQNYTVDENPEITIEANPDDLTDAKIEQLATLPVNRLSVGVQSFFEEDLRQMNRSHNSRQAKRCLEEATNHFKNISVDLMYGLPGMTLERWRQNVQTVLSLEIPHLSAYALTVEPRTALANFIKKETFPPLDDALAEQHFFALVEMLEANDFIHYEVSNFGKEGLFSRNNTAYWSGEKYIGIGPSAHSYNGAHRSWNVANNSQYIDALQKDELPQTVETLTLTDRYNEYVMTGLRTMWGVSINKVEEIFGPSYKTYLLQQAEKYIDKKLLLVEKREGDTLVLTTSKKGKFLIDGMVSDLFVIHSH